MFKMSSAHMEKGIGIQGEDGHHFTVVLKELSGLIEEGIQMVLAIARYTALEG